MGLFMRRACLWTGTGWSYAVLTWWPADVGSVGDLLSGTLALRPALGRYQGAGGRLGRRHETVGAVRVVHGGLARGAVVGSWGNATCRETKRARERENEAQMQTLH